MQSIAHQLKLIPENPGVYRYYDSEGLLLYIGKAKNLKKRVSSYFVKLDGQSAKTKTLVAKIANIEYTIVDNERDALLLENALIKEHQPKYNIDLKDDKSYPFIKITTDRFPKIYITRKFENDGASYFGPYTTSNQAYNLLDTIKKIFPIRNCNLNLSEKNLAKNKFKPCLEYHIGNCKAPCAQLQTESEYQKNIDIITEIVNGKLLQIKQFLRNEIELLAQQLEFEKAEIVKNKLITLNNYIQYSTIVNPGLGNFHVFGYIEHENKAFINYLYVYEGTIIKTKSTTITKIFDESKEYILAYCILDNITNDAKASILVPFIPDEVLHLNITIPKIGDKKKILELSQKNAKQSLLHYQKQPNGRFLEVLEIMKKDLHLTELPYHIECFDNSNIQGKFPVSACVVFKNGKPSKRDYRHFNVKTVEGPDDFATMKEIVYRRYKRMIEENQSLPQLIIIDGGKGQLSAAVESLKDLNIYGQTQIISIAKRLEELYYPEDSMPMYINKKSPTLKIIQQLRDEAHRFGITFHRQKRSKGTIKTELSNIDGIGEKIASKLLIQFKSVKNVKIATIEELSLVIGNHKANIIYNYFKNNDLN
jgi:excinuclease ABC subunit C